MCFGFPGRPTFGSGTGEENLSTLELRFTGLELGGKKKEMRREKNKNEPKNKKER